MSIIYWRVLYYTFGASGRNCKEVQNFRVSLDKKTKNNLKLLTKYCNLKISCFWTESCLNCILIINNLKLRRIFLTINSVILKFQILIHSNDFRAGVLFWHISVTFSEKIDEVFFKIHLLNSYKKNLDRRSPYFINITRSYICNFIQNRLPYKV